MAKFALSSAIAPILTLLGQDYAQSRQSRLSPGARATRREACSVCVVALWVGLALLLQMLYAASSARDLDALFSEFEILLGPLGQGVGLQPWLAQLLPADLLSLSEICAGGESILCIGLRALLPGLLAVSFVQLQFRDGARRRPVIGRARQHAFALDLGRRFIVTHYRCDQFWLRTRDR